MIIITFIYRLCSYYYLSSKNL